MPYTYMKSALFNLNSTTISIQASLNTDLKKKKLPNCKNVYPGLSNKFSHYPDKYIIHKYNSTYLSYELFLQNPYRNIRSTRHQVIRVVRFREPSKQVRRISPAAVSDSPSSRFSIKSARRRQLCRQPTLLTSTFFPITTLPNSRITRDSRPRPPDRKLRYKISRILQFQTMFISRADFSWLAHTCT